MKEITIQVADNIIKELIKTMKFKKILDQIHGVEDEFVLLVLYGLQAKKKIITIDEKQENETIKISNDLKEIMTEVKKGRKRGNFK